MIEDHGHRPRSKWGDGDLLAPWAIGDRVLIGEESVAFTDHRIPHAWSKHPEWCTPGEYLIVTAYSISEGDAWYFRVAPVNHPLESSDRLHMIPNSCDYTAAFTLIESADPEHAGREWPLDDGGPSVELTMTLNEYIERSKVDSNLFWRLPSGDHQNLLDEAIDRSNLGKADWIWVDDVGHVPSCIRQTRGPNSWERCGNGPLEDEAIETGDCGEH